MKPRFFHFADYATIGANNKLILVGIFDRIGAVQHAGQPMVVTGGFFFIASVTASIAEGSDHRMTLEVVDEDGGVVLQPLDISMAIASSGPGQPLVGNAIIRVEGIPVPHFGDYAFRLRRNGQIVGEHLLTVIPIPTPN